MVRVMLLVLVVVCVCVFGSEDPDEWKHECVYACWLTSVDKWIGWGWWDFKWPWKPWYLCCDVIGSTIHNGSDRSFGETLSMAVWRDEMITCEYLRAVWTRTYAYWVCHSFNITNYRFAVYIHINNFTEIISMSIHQVKLAPTHTYIHIYISTYTHTSTHSRFHMVTLCDSNY